MASTSPSDHPGPLTQHDILEFMLAHWVSGARDIAAGKEESASSRQFDSIASSATKAIRLAALNKNPVTQEEMDPLLVKHHLQIVWKGIIETVQVIDTLDPWQEKFLQLLIWTKNFDAMTKDVNNVEGARSWEEYGFAEELGAAWERLLKENEVKRMKNLAIFTAKALTAGVDDDGLGDTALWYFREALEHEDERVAPLLEVTQMWFIAGAYKLLALSVNEKGGFEIGPKALGAGIAENGFSMARWLFWRKRIQGLNHHEDPEVVKLARKVFLSNVAAGTDMGYDVPGEKKFYERMEKAMLEMLKSRESGCVQDTDIEINLDWVDE